MSQRRVIYGGFRVDSGASHLSASIEIDEALATAIKQMVGVEFMSFSGQLLSSPTPAAGSIGF